MDAEKVDGTDLFQRIWGSVGPLRFDVVAPHDWEKFSVPTAKGVALWLKYPKGANLETAQVNVIINPMGDVSDRSWTWDEYMVKMHKITRKKGLSRAYLNYIAALKFFE